MATWKHPNKGDTSFSAICAFIRDKVNQDNGKHTFRIYLGTDSQSHGNSGVTRYVTALILHTVGKGANFFIKKMDEPLAPSLRQKIWRESVLTFEQAIELDHELSDLFNLSNVEFQIHVDCGMNGPTKDLIKEVTSMFISAGYDVVTKPDSVAASSAADRFSK
ncbi:ribonuclease H-like YkuK family protein [Fodinisporobacter ferrooxydans]|uniref:Ribonuclease H-like YkuK family protein n=1 Tax=Fodinisporobacter ferrooxydans TaxID=2901836 RepID=A0ABY4CPB6_9BACL|nr:ribonuclease H-like YkuK family protein [Alicyclobacillaceae bacterium MYW30-H2]